MTGPKALPPHLLLDVDREIIRGVEGNVAELVPSVVGEAIGAGLLDFVHPVDRSVVGEWLAEGLGISPPFRRAAADDPPRWFRFVAAAAQPGRREVSVLFLDVTQEVREDALRQRLNSVLARYVGWSLVERAPILAAELAGSSHGCIAELHPPVAVIRASYGKGMPGPGTTIPITDSPIEEVASSRTMKLFPDRVQERFPDWPLLEMVGAQGIALVPVLNPATTETRAVLTCCSEKPLQLQPVERELLDLLATRLGSEFEAQEISGEKAPVSEDLGFEASDDLLRNLVFGMTLPGMTHTFNNLFAAQVLNLQLAAAQAGFGPAAATYLQRVEKEANRGARIVRSLRLLGGGDSVDWQSVQLDSIIEQAVRLVKELHQAADLEVDEGICDLQIWCQADAVLGLVVSLLEPWVDLVGEGGRTRAGAWSGDVENRENDWATVWIDVEGVPSPSQGGSPDTERSVQRCELGIAVVERFAARLGGRLTMESREGGTRFEIILPTLARIIPERA